MTPTRIINTGKDQTSKVQQNVFELGRISQDAGDTVATMLATDRGYAGSSELLSRTDHKHGASMAPASVIAPISFTTSSAGISNYFPRGDHQHLLSATLATEVCNVIWSTSTAGTHDIFAREDHVHLLKPGVLSTPAGRTTSQTYTNNGSGPLFVGISLALSLPAADGAHFQVNGVDIAHGDGPANDHFFLLGIVNPGGQYLLTATGGAHIEHWYEYGF